MFIDCCFITILIVRPKIQSEFIQWVLTAEPNRFISLELDQPLFSQSGHLYKLFICTLTEFGLLYLKSQPENNLMVMAT